MKSTKTYSLATYNMPYESKTATTVTSSLLNAFPAKGKITTMTFGKALEVSYSAFQNCSSLTTVNIPECRRIQYSAFAYCSKLDTVNVNRLVAVSYSVFYQCSRLNNINLSYCRYFGQYAFMNCYNLSFVNAMRGEIFQGYAFYNCSALNTIILNKVSEFTSDCIFANNSQLFSLYYLGEDVPQLNYINIFQNTPLSASYFNESIGAYAYGSIFVRESLVDAFKGAPNWIAYSDRVTGLTDEEVIRSEEHTSELQSHHEEVIAILGDD